VRRGVAPAPFGGDEAEVSAAVLPLDEVAHGAPMRFGDDELFDQTNTVLDRIYFRAGGQDGSS
jgi:hypothetical protein